MGRLPRDARGLEFEGAEPTEQPVHHVSIRKNFAIGRREVTFAEWDRCVAMSRLPTEAEWEYGARGGSTTPYLWGKDVGTGHAQCAECGGSESGRAAPVGSFRPNAFGLYDTAGNAAEWVEDCWNLSYRGAPSDGSASSGDCSLRVLRGGSFRDKAIAIRSSARFRYHEDVRYYANGFRVARDLD